MINECLTRAFSTELDLYGGHHTKSERGFLVSHWVWKTPAYFTSLATSKARYLEGELERFFRTIDCVLFSRPSSRS